MSRILRIVLTLAAAAAAMPAGPAAASDAFPSAVAPFRLSPEPDGLTPLEQEKLRLYKSQLQERVFDFERERPRLDVLENEELRRARREIELMDRIMQQGGGG